MILTKKQMMELLKILPSDKNQESTIVTQEIRHRLKDELDKIKVLEDRGTHPLIQFMSRVGYFETKDFIFNYLPYTVGVVITDKSDNTMIASFVDEELHYLPGKTSKDIKFKVCSVCGMPLQTGYRIDGKLDSDRYCKTCINFKLTEKFGKSKWGLAIEEDY